MWWWWWGGVQQATQLSESQIKIFVRSKGEDECVVLAQHLQHGDNSIESCSLH